MLRERAGMHSYDTTGAWPAPWFSHPTRTELASGHHLRPLRAADDGLPGLPAVAAEGPTGPGLVYGVFDDEERCVLGVVSLAPDPGADAVHDVVVRWSVPGSETLAAVLAEHLPGWLERAWPFSSPRVVRD